MPPLTVALLLLAAFLHASWNAILRGGADRLWSITMMGVVGGGVAAVAAFWAPAPHVASWPYLAFSAVLQAIYSLFLIRAYRDGHLAHVYPIARGTAPLLVAAGAWLIAGERLTSTALGGVALVSGGVMLLALGRDRPDARSAGAAFAAGAFIATYMVVDGVGVRLSQAPISYALWQAATQGVALLATYFALRRSLPAPLRGREGAKTAIAALIGNFGYGIALWAMSTSPMGQVSALRETSILFAAFLGAILLREPLSLRRIAGGATIAAGAICLSWS
jgi:drug/metabolite transporter (DMT)-like permease